MRDMHLVAPSVEVLQLRRRPLTSNLALGQDNNVVSEDVHLIEEVRREDDAALCPLRQQNLPDGAAREGIQARRALVD